MSIEEQEYQNKLNNASKEELINRVKELENKLYGMCEMNSKIHVILLQDVGMDTEPFNKITKIKEEYSKKLNMCLV